MVAYYAHSTKNTDKSDWQQLEEHLVEVAKKAEEFAQKAGIRDLSYVSGLLHDLGKYSSEFQRRLEGEKIRVDHSTGGAILAEQLYDKPWGKILSYIVAGHHGGIPDGVALMDRLKRKNLPDFSAYKEKIELPNLGKMQEILIKFKENAAFSIPFFIRMLYSCLVDADFLDTEKAFGSGHHKIRQKEQSSLSELFGKLDSHLERISKEAPYTSINEERGKILHSCRDKALTERGIFSLTVPTGGGKTLSSLAFALRHAILHKMDRVIYVIPYTSIIEQNAKVFRDVLGEEAVLEHQSNFSYPEEDFDEWDENLKRHRLAAENWDMPAIVTTSVQFFESLFSNKSSRCRKLHNMINSVIILDEAQMIPTEYLMPCLNALMELVRNYKSTVVFCTATQPALSELLPKQNVTEIIDDPKLLYEKFRRVEVKDIKEQSDDEIAGKILQHNQALCIVNTRRHARILYNLISKEQGAYHLSARMCPAHRTERLKEIRKVLESGKPCRVISTQLIEAGVDIDFPTVFRSSGGIDSIVQAAGRCNREGNNPQGDVYVFRPEEHGLPSGWLRRAASLGEMTLRQYPDNPISLDAVEHYFSNMYSIEGEKLDAKGILKDLGEGWKQLSFPFEDIDKKFEFIERGTQSVIVPYDDNTLKLMHEAELAVFPARFARILQPYSIQVYTPELMSMVKKRIARRVAELFWFIEDKSFYSDECGLLDPKEVTGPQDILIG